MKLRIVIDVEVSRTLAETIQRNGFTLGPDGTGSQLKIPNSPVIPRRKTKVVYIEDPQSELTGENNDSEKQENDG